MQSNLASALRDPLQEMPQSFNVYRNNYWVSILEAMKAAFPLTLRLTGEAYFTQISRAFLTKYPPKSRLMMEIGQGFPEFIASLDQDLDYLPDFTKLEQLSTESYHAGDALSLTPQDFARVTDLENIIFKFHPSVRLLKSEYPVFSIYNDLTNGIFEGGNEGVIVRPELDVHHYSADVDFLTQLHSGAKLGRCFTHQNETLSLIIQKGLACSITS